MEKYLHKFSIICVRNLLFSFKKQAKLQLTE